MRVRVHQDGTEVNWYTASSLPFLVKWWSKNWSKNNRVTIKGASTLRDWQTVQLHGKLTGRLTGRPGRNKNSFLIRVQSIFAAQFFAFSQFFWEILGYCPVIYWGAIWAQIGMGCEQIEFRVLMCRDSTAHKCEKFHNKHNPTDEQSIDYSLLFSVITLYSGPLKNWLLFTL